MMQLVDGNDVMNSLGIEYFKSGSTLGALSEQALEYILQKGLVYTLKKDDVLFQPGDRGDSFFIILQGTIAFYKQCGEEMAYLRDFHFGEEIGFVSMVALQDRPGRAVATTDSYVVEISSSLFYELHCEWPLDFGLLLMNLAREMARVIVELGNAMVTMSKTSQSDNENPSR